MARASQASPCAYSDGTKAKRFGSPLSCFKFFSGFLLGEKVKKEENQVSRQKAGPVHKEGLS